MNYEIMKQSETELQAQFIEFCGHVVDTWNFVLKMIRSGKAGSKDLDTIRKMEDQSNHYEVAIQDECIWAISKNQPFANHLRYIISILNSIRDLERTADYAVTATRYFVSNNDNISQDMRSLIGDTLHFAIITIKKIFNSINHKTAMEAYRVSQKSDLLFRKEYAKGLQRLSMILRNTNPDKIATLSQTAIIVLKHNERIVDHAINMAENFVFIKQKDFFLNKQNKQFNK